MQPNLYSYCILQDNGSAPNPFWGTCTLAICKPKIRKSAEVGDWLAGTGSSKNGFQNQLVYAMKVTKKMTFEDYDKYCRAELPEKIPLKFSKDMRMRKGDCLFDYSTGIVKMRDWGAHQLDDMTKDLSGAFVLLSNHFYYFGSQPVPIPSHLLKIVNQRPGHKKDLKKPYVEKFIEWITEFNEYKNKISAPPFGLLPQ
jgi:hypothetical protein